MPVAAVTAGGRPTVRAGSRIAAAGIEVAWPKVFVELNGEHLTARVAVLGAGRLRGATPERPLNIGASRCSPGS
jgi:hypothetical protein